MPTARLIPRHRMGGKGSATDRGGALGVGWALAGRQVLAVVSLAAVVPATRWVDAGRDDVD
ncbi:hypothetical protein [Micrococcus aloeverae]|nr:hypothetical protein FDF08_03420 [Micrococcus luteus]